MSFNLSNITTYSKTEAEKMATVTINQINGGIISATEAVAECTYMEAVIEQVKKAAKDAAVNEIIKSGTTVCKGVKLEVIEAGTKYDYSGDQYWQALSERINSLSELRKEHEALLKLAPDALSGKPPLEFTNPETGEIYTLRKAVKSSTTTIKATLTK
jgi:hypothetical protein